jgi:hypothetical protein
MSSKHRGWSESNNWLSYAVLRLATGVAGLVVGDRWSTVADHGLAVVVWTDPPVVTAVDATGAVVGPVEIG